MIYCPICEAQLIDESVEGICATCRSASVSSLTDLVAPPTDHELRMRQYNHDVRDGLRIVKPYEKKHSQS